MNDAKGCFVCLEHTCAILILIYIAVPRSVATKLFVFLQQNQHSIMSWYIVSEPKYGNEATVIMDIDQGNGFRPVL